MNTTRIARRLILVLASGLALAASGAEPEVHFFGDSTLHGFEGTASLAGWALEPGDAATYRAEARIPTASMTTDHRKRDANMMKMLEAEVYPELAGVLEAIPEALVVAEASEPVLAPMALTLHGETHEIPCRVTRTVAEDGEPVLDLTFTVSLKAFSLKPPSVLGVIRVADEVKVTARIPVRDTREARDHAEPRPARRAS